MSESIAPHPRRLQNRLLWKLTLAVRLALGGALFLVLVVAAATVGWFLSARRMFPFSQLIFRSMLRVLGVRLASEGRRQLTPRRGYVYIFNHASFLDHFVLASQVPSFLIGVEKIESRRIPLYGFLTRWWGNIAIDRRNPEQAIRTIANAQGILAAGVSICVAPEGTRSRDGRVGAFKRGGFQIAADMKAPLVPVSIIGMNDVNPDGHLLLRSGLVRLVFHPPIDIDGTPIEVVATRVRDQICSVGLPRRETRVGVSTATATGGPSG